MNRTYSGDEGKQPHLFWGPQRLMDSPAPPGGFLDYWASSSQAIDD
ncbi:hypothetical protein [Paenibacillus sp. FSL H8-0034]